MKKVLGLVLSLFLLFMAPVSAAGHEDIVDIAVGNEDFSILVAALTEADLVEALQGDGPFTVFAPTNAAFEALLTELDITAAQLLAQPDLSKVLLYHVISGAAVMSGDLTEGQTAETMNGEDITVSLVGGVFINDSEVIDADIEATNGVIHVIDKVLVPSDFELVDIPETVVDIALSSDDFSILVSALTEAGLVSTLQGEGPFTVFAPTNAAFAALLEQLEITAEELLAHPDLSKVLLYHVVSGRVLSTDLTDGMEATTLNDGEKVTVTLGEGVLINDSAVTTADIEALNGVVHVIDEVLVPANFTLEEEELIVETNDSNTLGWIILALAIGSGLVIISQPKLKKQS